MSIKRRRSQHIGRPWFARLCRAVAVLGLCFSATLHALTIGHSRIESAADENLQLSVLISGVSNQDIEQLEVQVAPREKWLELGLEPLQQVLEARVQISPGPRPDSVQVRFIGAAPVEQSVIDLLFDVRTADEEQRHQVSMLQQPRPSIQLPIEQGRAPATTQSSAATVEAHAETLTVRPGDSLHRIAQRIGTQHGSEYQLLAALYQLNPQAFGQDNMHLLFAGEQLRMPTAEQIQSMSDQQARQLYVEHMHLFNQYKEALARGATEQEATASLKTSVQAQAPTDTEPTSAASDSAESSHQAEYSKEHADRLRLDESDASDGQISADDRQAQEKALAHVRQEVEKLETEIDALSNVLKMDLDQTSEQQADTELTENEQRRPDVNASAKADAADSSTRADNVTEPETSAGGPASDAAKDPQAPESSVISLQTPTHHSTAASNEPGMLNGKEPAEKALASTNTAAQLDTDMEASWIQQHFIKLMLALLAFVVIFTIWILRRADKTTVELESPDRVTDEMIQAKLQDINLDLDVPPTDESGDVGRTDKP